MMHIHTTNDHVYMLCSRTITDVVVFGAPMPMRRTKDVVQNTCPGQKELSVDIERYQCTVVGRLKLFTINIGL